MQCVPFLGPEAFSKPHAVFGCKTGYPNDQISFQVTGGSLLSLIPLARSNDNDVTYLHLRTVLSNGIGIFFSYRHYRAKLA